MVTIKYACIIFLVFVSLVISVQKQSLLHPEAIERIPNYIDGRNLFAKVYDIDKNEYGLYQARELSHFFDYVDANFIKLSVLVGLPHFYSLVYFVSIFTIVAICLYIAKTSFEQKNLLIPSLVILIYLTSPVVFFSTYMFRSAKILVALGAVLTWLFITRFLSQKKPLKNAYLLVIAGALFLAMGDRQGLYILICITAFLLLSFFLFKTKKHLELFKYLAATVVISLIYSYIIAPTLIKIDIGHFPSFSYHKIDFSLVKPIFFRYSTLYSLDMFKYFLGNLNQVLVLFFLFNFLVIYIISQTKKGAERLKYAFLAALAIFAILILNTLLILKHNAIPLEDVRRVYYSLPLVTISLLFALSFCARVTSEYPKTYRYLLAALLLVLVSNVLSLSGHFKVIKNGLLKKQYEDSAKIVNCMNSRQETTSFGLREDYENFYRLVRR